VWWPLVARRARFHSLIVESSGNATLTALGSLLSALLAEQYAVVLGDGDDRIAPAVIEASLVWYCPTRWPRPA
jgi:DNA-binding FadR family transcriptional regulator